MVTTARGRRRGRPAVRRCGQRHPQQRVIAGTRSTAAVARDVLGGDAGGDELHAVRTEDDQLAGGDDDDIRDRGDDGDDVLNGGLGADYLFGGAGNDSYVFDAFSGSDIIVDESDTNRIVISGVTRDRIWITKFGDDLIISVIGEYRHYTR